MAGESPSHQEFSAAANNSISVQATEKALSGLWLSAPASSFECFSLGPCLRGWGAPGKDPGLGYRPERGAVPASPGASGQRSLGQKTLPGVWHPPAPLTGQKRGPGSRGPPTTAPQQTAHHGAGSLLGESSFWWRGFRNLTGTQNMTC